MELNIDNLEKWHFELTENACNQLLELVLQGHKRATSSSLESFQITGEKLPEEGSLSVITDWQDNPRCVVRTKRVLILPYKDIGFELARLEGEDESLASWQASHERFFKEEGHLLGYQFSPDMKVVFEEFEVVSVI